jgi:uncharacterized metal-binding protein
MECRSRVCLEGRPCPYLEPEHEAALDGGTRRILESTWDVALEEERTLCRLAELVYFGLEMGCERLGVAFCEELREPATILTGVLRRFFKVMAVGCRVGSAALPRGEGTEAFHSSRGSSGNHLCDPLGVAQILNRSGTDLNVLVGFCVGADCIFTRHSEALVTTIFVKDKSLANNPIGAVYSHYHLEDI